MSDKLTRRDFSKLSVAAFGGVVAGVGMTGCGGDGGKDGKDGKDGKNGKDGKGGNGKAAATHDVKYLLGEPHTCRGLNTCKGNGACKTAGNECKGKNTCAGTGKCASVANHSCRTTNDCKGQGGCGKHPAQNSCKGEGQCAVPLMDDAWTKARAAFEKAFKAKNNKDVGAAPAKG